jgi:hypothetical protein
MKMDDLIFDTGIIPDMVRGCGAEHGVHFTGLALCQTAVISFNERNFTGE